MKPSSAGNDDLIDRTIELWQPRLGHELTREGARQMAENCTGFFCILAEWSRAETATPASDSRYQPDRSSTSEVRDES